MAGDQTGSFNFDITLDQLFELDHRLSSQPAIAASTNFTATRDGNSLLRYERPKPKKVGDDSMSMSEKSTDILVLEQGVHVYTRADGGGFQLFDRSVCDLRIQYDSSVFVLSLGINAPQNRLSVSTALTQSFSYSAKANFVCLDLPTSESTYGLRHSSTEDFRILLRVLAGIEMYIKSKVEPVTIHANPDAEKLRRGDVVGLSYALWKVSSPQEPFESPLGRKVFATDSLVRLTIGNALEQDMPHMDTASIQQLEQQLDGITKGAWSLSLINSNGQHLLLELEIVKVKRASRATKEVEHVDLKKIAGAEDTPKTPIYDGAAASSIEAELKSMQLKLDLLLRRGETVEMVEACAQTDMDLTASLAESADTAVTTTGPDPVSNGANGELRSDFTMKLKEAMNASFLHLAIDESRSYTGSEVVKLLKRCLKGVLKHLDETPQPSSS